MLSNLLKSPRSTQTARIHKKSNNSNQIHQTKFKYSQIDPNPLRSAKSLKSCKIYPDQQKNEENKKETAEPMQINPKRLKSAI